MVIKVRWEGVGEVMEQYVNKNKKQLRCGITTGTCAAAAAQAAARHLVFGMESKEVTIYTPKGVTVVVPVEFVTSLKDKVEYLVVKDSGDDPDVTNHTKIYVSVEKRDIDNAKALKIFEDESKQFCLDGGEGVGRITQKGLEQEIGYAAINTVPRKMIFETVRGVCQIGEYKEKLFIQICVPEGKNLAKKTFNPRLGIEGGISILGTSGILEPMSEKAIIDTIEVEIRQKKAMGKERILVTPGNYGKSYVAKYLGLDMESSIKCSNYIGETLDLAVTYEIKQLLLVGNIGKLVKMAAGVMNTHSKVADARCEVFAAYAGLCGGTKESLEQIMECKNTDEMLAVLEKEGIKETVLERICKRIHEQVAQRVGEELEFGIMLFSEKYGFLGQTKDAGKILSAFERNIR